VDRACTTHEREEGDIEGFGGKASSIENTRKMENVY
jgi:hypothetical protein